MNKALIIALAGLSLFGCNDSQSAHNKNADNAKKPHYTLGQLHPDRTYVGKHNYITYEMSEKISFPKKKLTPIYQKFPQYHISRAKEWPKEDINDPSEYDLPRFEFVWANLAKGDKGYNEYEGHLKVWSMKTDGTDLRLVTDKFGGRNVKALTRSPNHRYVAWDANMGWKSVVDLKTGKQYTVAHYGRHEMVWSQDSRYLYFYCHGTKQDKCRWDSETGKITLTKMHLTTSSVIRDGKLIGLFPFGVGVYKQDSGKLFFSMANNFKLPMKKAEMTTRSIDPSGQYAWGSNNYFGWLFDIKNKTFHRLTDNYTPAQILGKDARYSALNRMANIVVVDRKKDKVWSWYALYTGKLDGRGSLYNGLANNGLWFKGAN